MTSAQQLRTFLCHASGDKSAVRQLHERLHEDGIQAWLDDSDLLPGQDWQAEIRRALRASHVVLVCLSYASINKEGYVQKEIRFVLDLAEEKPPSTIFIIPVKLEECPVPERLTQWQWVNLFESGGYSRLLAALHKRSEQLAFQTAPNLSKENSEEPAHRRQPASEGSGSKFAIAGEAPVIQREAEVQPGIQTFESARKQLFEFGRLALPCSLPPLLNLLLKVGPPPIVQMSVVTVALNFIAMMASFHFGSNLSRKKSSRWTLSLLLVFCAGLSATIALQLRFIEKIPYGNRDPVIKGTVLRDEVKLLIRADYTAEQALENAQFDAQRVWTERSINRVAYLLYGAWFTTWTSISIFVALFLLLPRSNY